MTPNIDPRTRYPAAELAEQEQAPPGSTAAMHPKPDHGETSYSGSGRLTGMRALITGGDSGIGRAVAIAYAREGADVAIVHLPQEAEDAADTLTLISETGRAGLSLAGDIRDEEFCRRAVHAAAEEFGGLDILVLNAGYQSDRGSVESISTAEIERVFTTNLTSLFWFTGEARQFLEPGACVIVTSSIQAFAPSPRLIDYAMTKAAQVAFVKALAEELGPEGIRVNAVAPGPIWTPLIPATGWPDAIPSFGQDTPLGRPGQPAELAPAYVMLASREASYISGAVVPVTGGKGL